MGEITGFPEGLGMQVPASDTKRASRSARRARLRQPLVVPWAAAAVGGTFLSDGNERINVQRPRIRAWIVGASQYNRVPREDQNEPRSDTPCGAEGGASVLDRNIVNRMRRVVIRSSNTASQSAAHCNRAQEQSLAPQLRAPIGDSEGA